MQSLWLPAIQMQLALSRKDLSYALNATQSVFPIEYGTILFVANSFCFYPTYIRGESSMLEFSANAFVPLTRAVHKGP